MLGPVFLQEGNYGPHDGDIVGPWIRKANTICDLICQSRSRTRPLGTSQLDDIRDSEVTKVPSVVVLRPKI